MLYFLTSVFMVLAHSRSAAANNPIRDGMTVQEVCQAFGQPYQAPYDGKTWHKRVIDWLGGKEAWTIFYLSQVAAPDNRDRVVFWMRDYRPFLNPPSFLQPIVDRFDLMNRPDRYFPDDYHESEEYRAFIMQAMNRSKGQPLSP